MGTKQFTFLPVAQHIEITCVLVGATKNEQLHYHIKIIGRIHILY